MMNLVVGILLGVALATSMIMRNVHAFYAWTLGMAMAGEKIKIKAQLKQGLSILEIAQNYKHNNQDDILAIKNEMWDDGWEN
jgi:hypothetical protein